MIRIIRVNPRCYPRLSAYILLDRAKRKINTNYLKQLINALMLSRLKWLKIFRYYYIIVIVFAGSIIIVLSVFLYRNFYQTITQSGVVLMLKEQTLLESIDTNLLKQVLGQAALKKAGSPGFLIKDKSKASDELTNPFDAYEVAKPAS